MFFALASQDKTSKNHSLVHFLRVDQLVAIFAHDIALMDLFTLELQALSVRLFPTEAVQWSNSTAEDPDAWLSRISGDNSKGRCMEAAETRGRMQSAYHPIHVETYKYTSAFFKDYPDPTVFRARRMVNQWAGKIWWP